MIAPDLAMINIIGNLPHNHIILLAHITYPYPLIAPINFTLVLVNAPLVLITPFSDYTNHYIVILLTHVLMVIEVDHTQHQEATPTNNTNPLLI